MGGQWLRWLLLAVVLASPATDVRLAAQTADEIFLASLGELREASFVDKEAIAERMITAGHPRVRAALTALLEDRLYSRTADNRIFIVKTTEGDLSAYALVDPVSGTDAGEAPPDALAKIGSNNRLRRSLRTALARFGLSSPDPAVRLGAIQDMLRSLDEPTVALLRERKAVETDAGGPDGDRHGPGDGRPRRNRHRSAPRGDRNAFEPAWLGRAEQTRHAGGTISGRQLRRAGRRSQGCSRKGAVAHRFA